MATISAQHELQGLLALAHGVTSRLSALQASQQHKQLEKLSERYTDSSGTSGMQARVSLIATLAFSAIGPAAEKFAAPGLVQNLLSALSKNGAQLGDLTQKIILEPRNIGLNGQIRLLDLKLSNQQGQSTSAKTTEDVLRQTAAAVAQQFQRSIGSAA